MVLARRDQCQRWLTQPPRSSYSLFPGSALDGSIGGYREAMRLVPSESKRSSPANLYGSSLQRSLAWVIGSNLEDTAPTESKGCVVFLPVESQSLGQNEEHGLPPLVPLASALGNGKRLSRFVVWTG